MMNEEPIFFDNFADLKEKILNLREKKQLHSQVEANIKHILSSIEFAGHPISEINQLGGRADVVFFLYTINKSIQIEIFASKSQVVQDLRLLEQSIYDERVAVLIDEEIDLEVSTEYYHKNPKTNFHVFVISDFFMNQKLNATKDRLKQIITAMNRSILKISNIAEERLVLNYLCEKLRSGNYQDILNKFLNPDVKRFFSKLFTDIKQGTGVLTLTSHTFVIVILVNQISTIMPFKQKIEDWGSKSMEIKIEYWIRDIQQRFESLYQYN